MAGGLAVELAELLQLFHGHPPHKMEECILEHGFMAGGQDKAVTIEPLVIIWIEFQIFLKEYIGKING